jgi:hypothetical protein
MIPEYGQIEIDYCTYERRPSDSGPYVLIFMRIAGERYQVSVSPKGKSVRFFHVGHGELK